MNNMEILANAFSFIEDNLHNDIRTQDVAEACYCSKSVLEKIFKCINGNQHCTDGDVWHYGGTKYQKSRDKTDGRSQALF